jgi:hypothetical protein
MRTITSALGAGLILAAALTALSCDNSIGVFSRVQNERSQAGTKVFQETSVYNAFRLGSNYYAATATLNAKPVSGSSGWTRVAIGSGSYTLRSVVLDDVSVQRKIYALVETGGSIKLYRSSDGSTWTIVPGLPAQTLSGTSAFTLDAIYAANGELYAESHGPYDATVNVATNSPFALLHYDTSTSAFVAVSTFAPAVNMTVRGVVGDGTHYWFASEDKIVSGLNADGSDAADVSSGFVGFSGSGKTIWAISFAGGKVYISTKDGTLYQNGAVAGYSLTTSFPLTQVVQVPAASGSSLLVGTDANAASAVTAEGYYEGAFQSMVLGSSGVVDNNSAIYGTTVVYSPVHAFFYDGDPTVNSAAGKLFICVSPSTMSSTYYGLYSSVWDPATSTWSGWSAE